jgi:hypothetical protein
VQTVVPGIEQHWTPSKTEKTNRQCVGQASPQPEIDRQPAE